MMPFRRVVVGVDFTDPTRAAARWASVQFAPETEIVLADVTPEPALDELCELAARLGRSRTSVEVISGPPAEGLLAIARRSDADAICLSPNVRGTDGPVDETIVSRLLSLADVPVIVVPPRIRAAPTVPTPGPDSSARPTPFIIGRTPRRATLVLPRPPRRPGPGGGDAA